MFKSDNVSIASYMQEMPKSLLKMTIAVKEFKLWYPTCLDKAIKGTVVNQALSHLCKESHLNLHNITNMT